MNSVILIGRLTAEPELRETKTGMHTCSFTVAVDRYNKEKENTADFIRCVAFHTNAKTICDFFHKGSRIAINGNIKTGSYEKDGQKVFTADIWVDRVEFVENRKDTVSAYPARRDDIIKTAQNAGVDYDVISDGELPF